MNFYAYATYKAIDDSIVQVISGKQAKLICWQWNTLRYQISEKYFSFKIVYRAFEKNMIDVFFNTINTSTLKTDHMDSFFTDVKLL